MKILGFWENVESVDTVDDLSVKARKCAKTQAFRGCRCQGDFHNPKKNIHKPPSRKRERNLWILWIIIFRAKFRRFYAHLRPP